MDDATLRNAFRRQLASTTLAAVARETGLNRNTLRALKQGTHGMNSSTRAKLSAWVLSGALVQQVCRDFKRGASTLTVGARYGLTQRVVEQMLRKGL